MFDKKTEDVYKADLIQDDVNEGLMLEVKDETEFSSDDNVHDVVKSFKPSLISEGFEFIGEIKTAGSLTVEGSIVGKVSVDHLIVGVAGVVDGILEAKTIFVKGRLSGDITCSDITVCGRSSVDGKLTYSSITIQRGGSIEGDLKKIA